MKDYRNKYYIIFGLIAVSILCGCKNKSSEGYISCNDEDSEEYVDERLLERQEAIKAAEKHEEDDGFVWYSYEYNGKMGIVNEDGEILIWDNYDGIHYSNKGPFLELNYKTDKGRQLDVATQDCVIKAKGINAIIKESTVIDRENGRDGERYWYRVLKDDDRTTKVGAYSKNWELICPPIFCVIEYVRPYNGDIEYFNAKLERDDELRIIINYKLDEYGNLIGNETPKNINYYIRRRFFNDGTIDEIVRPVMFYDDYIVWWGNICPFYRHEMGINIYKSRSDTSPKLIYVDKNYDIRVEYIGGNSHPWKDEWKQMLAQNGEPIYNSLLKKAKQRWAEYEQLE